MPDVIRRLRRDAIGAFQAAVAAVQPANLMPKAVDTDGIAVRIWGEPIAEVAGRRVVAAIGKAAPTLADAWLELLPGWADRMFVLAPHGVPVSDRVATVATVRNGSHPYPDEHGVTATRELLEIAHGLEEGDLLLVLLSGGGSALLAAPEPGLTLSDLRATTEALLKAGAPITTVNTVRRELLAAAGGGLARAAFPARVVTLVLSDVLGDPLPSIASGPTVESPTTAAHALWELDRFRIRAAIPPAVVQFLTTHTAATVDADWVPRSRVKILANNQTAIAAAAATLSDSGYRTVAHSGLLQGEAAERGRQLAALGRAMRHDLPTAFAVGGETTVTVRGNGRGGRNHELALAAALSLEHANDVVVLSAGTDGIDGLTEAAGAVVDPNTAERLRANGFDPHAALADNDSGPVLAAIADAIVTGPTGTNVCDVSLVLAGGSK